MTDRIIEETNSYNRSIEFLLLNQNRPEVGLFNFFVVRKNDNSLKIGDSIYWFEGFNEYFSTVVSFDMNNKLVTTYIGKTISFDNVFKIYAIPPFELLHTEIINGYVDYNLPKLSKRFIERCIQEIFQGNQVCEVMVVCNIEINVITRFWTEDNSDPNFEYSVDVYTADEEEMFSGSHLSGENFDEEVSSLEKLITDHNNTIKINNLKIGYNFEVEYWAPLSDWIKVDL